MKHHHLDWQTSCRRLYERLGTPQQPRGDVHVIACHYNPHGWFAPADNLVRFRAALPPGTPLTIVEASFNGRFDVPDAVQIHATADQIMWQKERLLRLAVAALPASVDKIAWIDADVFFANKHVLEHASQLLDHCPVVQLFDFWHRTDACGRAGFDQQSVAHRMLFGKSANARPCAAPGGAWAARRDVAARIFDAAITGSGDSVCWSQWTGSWHLNKDLPPALERQIKQEGQHIYRLVRGRVGCVPGLAIHLFHGTHQDRRYGDRRQMPARTGFDPARDLTLAPNGLWSWTGSNPRLQEYCREIFAFRKEDQ